MLIQTLTDMLGNGMLPKLLGSHGDVRTIALPQQPTGPDMSTTTPELTDVQQVAEELVRRLSAQYGTVLSSNALIKELGYPSAAAFQQALARGVMPVPVFKLEHRRGSFALTQDVAMWLSRQRSLAKGGK